MRKGKKSKQPIKPRVVTEASAPASAPVRKAAAARGIVFSAEPDAFALKDGKVSAWTSGDGKISASQDDAGAMPAIDFSARALAFDKACLTIDRDAGVAKNPKHLTLAVGFRVADADSSQPMALLSKGSYDSSVVYVDLHEGNLRVKLGDGRLNRISLAERTDDWINLVLFDNGGTVQAVVDGTVHDCGPLTGFGANDAPLVVGARTQNGVTHCYLNGAIRYLYLDGSAHTVEQALDLQSSLTGAH